MTQYHAKYYASFLSLQQPSRGVQRLGSSLLNATIDLNPHQVEGALFYFQNPLSKGVILADEVGLGKTIEAGLILCQLRSEHKRKILLIVPAALRKQWANELQDKFFLPSQILDGTIYKQIKSLDNTNPFDQKSIVICSYHFAASHSEDIQDIDRDVAVLDEAHKLRNVYKELEKEANVFNDELDQGEDESEEEKKKISMSKKIKDALDHTRKILLTATPLQNSLLELYGLTSYLDDYLFGDLVSFKEQYMNKTLSPKIYKDLQDRLSTILHRTLRRQVQPYINYTNRKAHSQDYMRTPEEQAFYDAISAFLQESPIFTMKNGRPNFLLLLIYWKIMASSTYAIIGTLHKLKAKLEYKLEQLIEQENIKENRVVEVDIIENVLPSNLDEEDVIDQDMLATYQEEAEDNQEDGEVIYEGIQGWQATELSQAIKQVKHFISLAQAITKDSKIEALVKAIGRAYQELEKLGAQKKILIFTESRRTQQYLFDYLSEKGYKDKIILFNGTNNDSKTQEVYKTWKQKYENTSHFTGSKSVDTRSAIVDYFRNSADIMIATESAAEGINLQFCSLIINYDLPWNPQRVEQRIGRCHRYGQEHDVIVMNLLNTSNEADQKVYHLLQSKFQLFDGMFGASDEILGQLESGVDIERSILEIYQNCRTKEEIKEAFDKLGKQMESVINTKMKETKQQVLEKLDQEVAEKLKDRKNQSTVALDKSKKFAWFLIKNVLADKGKYDDDTYTATVLNSPGKDVPTGTYAIINGKDYNAQYAFRTNDGLGAYVIGEAKNLTLPYVEITFDITNNPGKISVVEQMKGSSGYLHIELFRINAYHTEEYFVYACIDDKGNYIDEEIAEKLMLTMGSISQENIDIGESTHNKLNGYIDKEIAKIKKDSSSNTHDYFSLELSKLDKWANDLRVTLERKVKKLAKQINENKSTARRMKDLMERLALEKQIARMEKRLKVLRRKLYDEEDSLEQKKRDLIDELEAKMTANYEQEELFTIKWKVV